MAKQRYINTKFWNDNYIVELDPIEKLLFLYFLTSPLTNVSGIYEISLRRVAFDTGIDKEMVNKILLRFEVDNKIKYENGWLAIKNFVKHQALNPKIQKGIEIEQGHAPKNLLKWTENSLLKPIDSLSKPSNYSNTNTNTNSNTKVEKDMQLFNKFWNLYDKKVGKPNTIKAWIKLDLSTRQKIMSIVPAYVKAKVKKYRKDPERYLKHKAWEDEIIGEVPAGSDPEPIPAQLVPFWDMSIEMGFLGADTRKAAEWLQGQGAEAGKVDPGLKEKVMEGIK